MNFKTVGYEFSIYVFRCMLPMGVVQWSSGAVR